MSLGNDESVLDDPDALAAGDPGGMLRAVATAGAQLRAGALGASEADLATVVADGRPRSMVVTGMGGSGITGDVVAAVGGPTCPVPLVAHRGYRLPGWVGPMDLVVAVSASGRTEETLAVADAALRRGCRLVTVGQAGSPLSERSAGGRAVHIAVDTGGRMPRTNLWALAVPVLILGDALGLMAVPADVLAAVADDLDRISGECAPGVESYDNPAKRLAAELSGTLPYVWGTSELAGVAAYRAFCQLAENAKHPSVWGVLPEAHHNQVVAFAGAFGTGSREKDDDIFRDRVSDESARPRIRLLVLRDSEELPEVARRRDATMQLAEEYAVPAQELAASGEHPLARLASLVAPTDFASVYLALLEGTDPTPIEPIDTLKASIAR
ncbi:MAG: glucose/mannose-6-phosphate isomerase [Actinomycetota bacterium]|jgi:glucose/mannose-6-phosphate isomerase|nr:glucose/mannose-6-phosphate isomerase [Actinomycetota bacterium]